MKQITDFYVYMILIGIIKYGYSNTFSCQILNDDEVQECPLINEPVCAVIKKDILKCDQEQCRYTYQNKCEACKNSKILDFVIEGPCEDYPKKAVFCGLHRNDLACDSLNTRKKNRNKQVCGFYNLNTKCNLNPCFEVYPSSCHACNNELVDFYLEGPCPIMTSLQFN
ncbi:hypothetical protein ABPG74_012215 [Tetrahymena malaccensis]